MGRSRKFSEPLAKPRSFRLERSADEKLAKKLGEADLKLSEYIRKVLHQDKTVVVARPQRKLGREDRLEVLRLTGQLNKVGNNINQIAHRLNTDYLAGTVSEMTYREILVQLENVFLDMKKCLPKWD